MKFNHVFQGNVKPVWSRAVRIAARTAYTVPSRRLCHQATPLVLFVVSFVRVDVPRPTGDTVRAIDRATGKQNTPPDVTRFLLVARCFRLFRGFSLLVTFHDFCFTRTRNFKKEERVDHDSLKLSFESPKIYVVFLRRRSLESFVSHIRPPYLASYLSLIRRSRDTLTLFTFDSPFLWFVEFRNSEREREREREREKEREITISRGRVDKEMYDKSEYILQSWQTHTA